MREIRATYPLCASCGAVATCAIKTQRPTHTNLWTKVWWSAETAPASAEPHCGACVAHVLASLARTLA